MKLANRIRIRTALVVGGTFLGTFMLLARRGASAQIGNAVPESELTSANEPIVPVTNLPDKILYSFCPTSGCPDGSTPYGTLVLDSKGNLYGTTQGGGSADGGTVFKVTPAGVETVLYSFCQQTSCTDGNQPQAGVILDSSGNLYGTTRDGGSQNEGIVFKLDPLGVLTVLYNFCSVSSCKDGVGPLSSLIRDSAGNLYGTTPTGGAYDGGTVFQVTSTGSETVLYSFCLLSGCPDGQSPSGPLVSDSSGNLYGTTEYGGNKYGTVFKLDAAELETVLYAFCPVAGCTDGAQPVGGLTFDASGNLYGTTYDGGATCHYGVLFEIDTADVEHVLHNFCATSTFLDGALPESTPIFDSAGNIFVTTFEGGSKNWGTVIRLNASGVETGIHNFGIANDGGFPEAGLIRDKAGNLYGTTSGGGAHNHGAVYKIPAVTVRLTSSPNPSAVGQSVTLSVVVSGISQQPTGSVSFLEGTTSLGTASLADGKASISTSFPASGTYSIVARYSGDANYQPTNSTALKQVVQ
jgi:uncharacterized repeat protein (TIGR03803 family)